MYFDDDPRGLRLVSTQPWFEREDDCEPGFASHQRWVHAEIAKDHNSPRLWLVALAGGFDELAALDAEPLPDEPFEWSAVVSPDRPVVQRLLELVDGFCAAHADVEIATVCRRLMARIARNQPAVLRGKQTERVAASIVYCAGAGNDMFGRRDAKGRAALTSFFDLKSDVSPRAHTIWCAAGVGLRGWAPRPRDWYGDDQPLGDASLLHSRVRRYLVQLRDALDAA